MIGPIIVQYLKIMAWERSGLGMTIPTTSQLNPALSQFMGTPLRPMEPQPPPPSFQKLLKIKSQSMKM